MPRHDHRGRYAELDAEPCRIDPCKLTKVGPYKDYPLINVGVLELNWNPDNCLPRSSRPYSVA